jgi:hypothetical protein
MMIVVHKVKAIKQKKPSTSTFQKNKYKQNEHKNKARIMKTRGNKLHVKGGQTSCTRPMITTHQKKVTTTKIEENNSVTWICVNRF